MLLLPARDFFFFEKLTSLKRQLNCRCKMRSPETIMPFSTTGERLDEPRYIVPTPRPAEAITSLFGLNGLYHWATVAP